jgi:hypothetical protein
VSERVRERKREEAEREGGGGRGEGRERGSERSARLWETVICIMVGDYTFAFCVRPSVWITPSNIINASSQSHFPVDGDRNAELSNAK